MALFLLLRDALLSNVEDTARKRAMNAAKTISSADSLEQEDVEELTLDGVFVIVRNGKGDMLPETVNLPSGGGAGDPVWRRALLSDEPRSGTANLSGDDPEYIYAVPVDPVRGSARVVEAGKSYEQAFQAVRAVGAILAPGIGVAFLLSIGGAHLLARAASRPVEAVTATAREMGEGNSRSGYPLRTRKTKSDAWRLP